MQDRRRKLAQKIAKEFMTQALGDHMQATVSQARVQLSDLESMLDRGVALIQDSEHKEHIYKEAGDLISRFQVGMSDLKAQLATLNYIIGHLAATDTFKEIPSGTKKELDRLLQATRNRDPALLQGLPTFIEDVPKAIEKTRADEESIHEVERADDVSKRSPTPNRDVIDYSGFSTFLGKPDVKQNDVP
jgi:hypothetical protein